jgi:hypothetical protein
MANLVDLYLVYRVLRQLTTPFENWDAYKTGVIDAEGNLIKKAYDRRTAEEQESFTKFDLLMLKLKKVLGVLPFGKTKLASYAAALFLIKEEKNLTEENLEERFMNYCNKSELINEKWSQKYKRSIDCNNPKGFSQRAHCQGKEKNEDAPANNVGGGNIAGTQGDPPRPTKVMMRRFAQNDVFVVDQQRFNNARMGKKKFVKYEKYVGSDDVGNAIRDFGRKYPKKPIILQDEKTGSMIFLRHGRSGMFTEQFDNKPKEITQADLKTIEVYADKLFKAVGIDVNFTRHFLDRVNDARNVKQITPDELTDLFRKSYEKYGKKISKLGPDAEAVLNDMRTNINMPFVLNWDRNSQELDLVAKTVMRKKNFMTQNQKLSV